MTKCLGCLKLGETNDPEAQRKQILLQYAGIGEAYGRVVEMNLRKKSAATHGRAFISWEATIRRAARVAPTMQPCATRATTRYFHEPFGKRP
jgi:hypothetical protein